MVGQAQLRQCEQFTGGDVEGCSVGVEASGQRQVTQLPGELVAVGGYGPAAGVEDAGFLGGVVQGERFPEVGEGVEEVFSGGHGCRLGHSPDIARGRCSNVQVSGFERW